MFSRSASAFWDFQANFRGVVAGNNDDPSAQSRARKMHLYRDYTRKAKGRKRLMESQGRNLLRTYIRLFDILLQEQTENPYKTIVYLPSDIGPGTRFSGGRHFRDNH